MNSGIFGWSTQQSTRPVSAERSTITPRGITLDGMSCVKDLEKFHLCAVRTLVRLSRDDDEIRDSRSTVVEGGIRGGRALAAPLRAITDRTESAVSLAQSQPRTGASRSQGSSSSGSTRGQRSPANGGARKRKRDAVDTTPKRRHRNTEPNVGWMEDESTLAQRFVKEIGLWLLELGQVHGRDNYEFFETLAGDLIPPTTEATESMTGPDRVMRARILIGLACVYEQNLRLSKLNQCDIAHNAWRRGGKNATYLNMGRSQAQMVCKAFDVKKATRVFTECVERNEVPPPPRVHRANKPYPPSDEAERCFPEHERKRLYNLGCQQYVEKAAPEDQRLVITYEQMHPTESGERWSLVPPARSLSRSTDED